MCGIAISLTHKKVPGRSLTEAIRTLKRRGPDSATSQHHKFGDFHLELIHTRLAILDLSQNANQPFEYLHYVIVYNGELYNFRDLKSELKLLGYKFRTRSDTEVIIAAFDCWGQECVHKFRGMWALCIFDRKKCELFLSRDVFGEKPLFLFEQNGELFFASNINAIEALIGRTIDLDYKAVKRFLQNGYKAIFHGNSCFKIGLDVVPPATNIIVRKDGSLKSGCYWAAPCEDVALDITFDEAVKEVRSYLVKAIERVLTSDVEVAFCLSGGIDSGSIVSIAHQVFGYKCSTFSIIDRDPRYNESLNIDKVVSATSSTHTDIEIAENLRLEDLKDLIDDRQLPVSTISYLAHAKLVNAVSGSGYKVCLSGTGADEIFTGYFEHYMHYLADVYGTPNFDHEHSYWSTYVKPLVRNEGLKNIAPFMGSIPFKPWLSLESNNDLLNANPEDISVSTSYFSGSRLKSRMADELFVEVVPPILREDDANSMYCSVENRSPFLDFDLVSFVQSLPAKLLIKNGFSKALLREAVSGILPDAVRLDRKKVGFNAALDNLIDLNCPQTRSWLLEDHQIFDFVNYNQFKNKMNTRYDSGFEKFVFAFLNCKMLLSKN